MDAGAGSWIGLAALIVGAVQTIAIALIAAWSRRSENSLRRLNGHAVHIRQVARHLESIAENDTGENGPPT